jgi:hypothetical protein
MSRIVLSVAALLSLFALPAAAQAYWPYGGGYGWNGWGQRYQYYSTTYNDVQPYYSVYPPVYYSPYITARPYGASPYAWPAGVSPITTVTRGYARPMAEPLMIVNPYVQGAAAEAAPAPARESRDAAPATTAPVSIENPYVASAGR